MPLLDRFVAFPRPSSSTHCWFQSINSVADSQFYTENISVPSFSMLFLCASSESAGEGRAERAVGDATRGEYFVIVPFGCFKVNPIESVNLLSLSAVFRSRSSSYLMRLSRFLCGFPLCKLKTQNTIFLHIMKFLDQVAFVVERSQILFRTCNTIWLLAVIGIEFLETLGIPSCFHLSCSHFLSNFLNRFHHIYVSHFQFPMHFLIFGPCLPLPLVLALRPTQPPWSPHPQHSINEEKTSPSPAESDKN